MQEEYRSDCGCNLVRDGEESPSEETAALQEFKNGFDGCRNDGPLMVYICKLFSVKGCDIVGSNLGSQGKSPTA